MKEDFMHYVWRFKLLDFRNLKTTNGLQLQILNFGTYTQAAGPDFFNALLKIGSHNWAGNIEMHLKSSDWYVHNHHLDHNYNNVILHVVWEHDVDVFYPDNKKIPVLVLKNYVPDSLIDKYHHFFAQTQFIPCGNQILTVPPHIINFFKERLFIERLAHKAEGIENLRKLTLDNWEQITFIALCKGFGLNTNAAIFEQMALAIPFSTFLKGKESTFQLEALFMGLTNLIPQEPCTDFELALQREFTYQAHKFKLQPLAVSPSFFKHRPDNFPTLRLAQLAQLFAGNKNSLFQTIHKAKSVAEFYQLFQISASEFWNTHYTFQSSSPYKVKKISKAFIQLLVVNTIIPLLYCYAQSTNQLDIDALIQMIKFLPPEKNNTITFFDKLHVPIETAFDSQAFLHLKKNYCDSLQCLHCAIGKYLIQ